ncbi:MAG TPA: family 20 glycosylhydrolase, partial [Terrimicrobiaceae bacterium]|nr:family 20 glycosylhydrolase [Terrimicrobiaceae bacterium]
GHAELFLQNRELAHLAETREPFTGRFGPGRAQVFCPSQPATYEFLRRYLREVSEAFPSAYFHAGCDETWDIGCCDLCQARLHQGESQADIFTKHLLTMHQIVTGELGKKMIIWDDMFEFYPEALEAVPRDVILACWQYHDHVTGARGHFFNRRNWDALALYDRLGFEYLICPSDYTQTIHNAETFTAYAAKHRPLGGLMTTWEKSDSFLLQSMPLLACVGRLWESGRVQNCDIILKGVIADLFGLDDELFYRAIQALCSNALGMERRISLDDFLTRRENTSDYGRRSLGQVLLALLPAYIDRITRSSRPILLEILLSLRSEHIGYRLDALLPEFFLPHPASGHEEAQLNEIRSALRDVAEERLTMWEQVRPGIAPEALKSLYKAYLENLGRIPEQSAANGALVVHFFLPDQYSSQTVRILIRYQDSLEFEKICEGVFKDMRTFDCFFSKIFLISNNRIPADLKIETFGFGGQGFTFFEIMNQRGRFVPARIHALHGMVSDPENLLAFDWTWSFAGERNARAGFLDPAKAAAVHGFEVALQPADGLA